MLDNNMLAVLLEAFAKITLWVIILGVNYPGDIYTGCKSPKDNVPWEQFLGEIIRGEITQGTIVWGNFSQGQLSGGGNNLGSIHPGGSVWGGGNNPGDNHSGGSSLGENFLLVQLSGGSHP